MPRPLVGLSTYIDPVRRGTWEKESAFTPTSYVDAVSRVGATPVLLPPSATEPADVLAPMTGLVLIGGGDVDPDLYGAERDPRTNRPRKERDAWEIGLCLAALDADLPLLAICRGAQVLNVALGGTLHQHLESAAAHDGRTNRIAVAAGSRLASVVGEDVEGHCHHHQGLDQVAPGLRVVARAADGTVEAVEVLDKGFAVGVQWHPEDQPRDDRLFAALVAAGRNRTHAG
jgi:gamma-glutamyl-gamma-aminobutyrate hydrolase PuuD